MSAVMLPLAFLMGGAMGVGVAGPAVIDVVMMTGTMVRCAMPARLFGKNAAQWAACRGAAQRSQRIAVREHASRRGANACADDGVGGLVAAGHGRTHGAKRQGDEESEAADQSCSAHGGAPKQ